MLRLFVAVEIPDGQRAAVAAAIGPLRRAITTARWTGEQAWHVTLKFLGAVPDEQLAAVAAIGREVAAGSPPGSLQLTGFGAFPSPRRARVIWVGMDDAGGTLAAAAASLEERYAAAGFRAEARAWTPHLTVARLPLPGPVDLPAAGELAAAAFTVSELVLFRSHLHPSGAVYEPIERFPLAG
jgi:2'-5' RNA ligase